MKESYYKWYSPNLSKDIEMLVYGHQGYPVVLFPSSMGRYYESKDFGLIESARWFVDVLAIRVPVFRRMVNVPPAVQLPQR